MSAADEFVKMFERTSRGQSYYEHWVAFVSTLAAFIASASMNPCKWLVDKAESSMGSVICSRDEMAELHEACIEAFEENPGQDLLGDAYMKLGIGSRENGQFFTPYHLSRLMADMGITRDEVERGIAEHGYVTVNDPAAGGGANLIAAANVLQTYGINYQQKALFVAQELSEMTALACYVQMSLLGMPGIVQIGDTLRMDYRFELWTPMLALDETWLYRMMARMVFGCNRI